ncbi:ADP-ribosyltransferase [Mycolicibacterium palauense]|uniref:ADP-ribosyltransferase n=1 Tax=Mycolicibacterium palauense TaxID=2034511 RepID=UPI000BFEF3DA|nr:ADP-ribosyltransferase [Mycolicibacterium palauense]
MAVLAGEAAIRIIPTLKRFKVEADTKLAAMRFDPVEIDFEANMAGASAEVAAWRRRQELDPVTVPVRADFQQFRRDLSTVEHIFKRNSLSRALRLNVKVIGLDALPALAYAAGSATSALDALGKSAFALPGLLGGAAASVGALAVGMRGLGAAFQAYATDSKNAEQNARDQQRANRDLERSYRDYRSAVRDTIREIQDLNRENRRSSLNVADAVLGVQEAAQRLREGGQRSLLELRRDQLSYLQAVDHLQDVQVRAKRVAEDTFDANQKGVQNADSVVDALDRISDALDTVEKGNISELDKAMEKLAPNAQSAVRALLDFKGAWNRLSGNSQNNLFQDLDRTITNLGNKALPTLDRGLSRTASGLNANLKALAASLGTDQNQSFLDRIFGANGTALQRFSAAFQPLIDGVLRLTSDSAQFLPRIADAFTRVLDRFDAFTQRVSDDGTLNEWIDSGLDSLTALGNTLLNIASIISSVSRAFAQTTGFEGGFITTIERATSRLADFLKEPSTQQGLTNYFSRARDLVGQILSAVKDMRPFIGDMVETAREWSTVLFSVLGTFSKIAGWVEKNTGLAKNLLIAYLSWRTARPIVEGLTTAWQNYGKVMGGLAQYHRTSNFFGPMNRGLNEFKANLQSLGGVAAGAAKPIKLSAEAVKNVDKAAFPALSSTKDLTKQFENAGGAAVVAAGKIGSAGRGSLLGALKGLGLFIGPGLAFSAAISALTLGISALGDAHRKAAQDADAHNEALKQLQTTVDQTTGSADKAAALQAAQTFTFQGQGQVNTIDAAARSGLAGPNQFGRALLPINDAERQSVLQRGNDMATKAVQNSDSWKKSGDIWEKYGVSARDLALAASTDQKALDKVRAAYSAMLVDQNIPSWLPEVAKQGVIAGKRATGNLPDDLQGVVKSTGQGDLFASLSALRDIPNSLSAGAAQAQQVNTLANGLGSVKPGVGVFAGSGVSEVHIDDAGNAVVITDRKPAVPAEDGTVAPNGDGRFRTNLTVDGTEKYIDKFADGGLVGGVGGPRDDANLAMLSRGEHVTNAAAVKYYGVDFFNRLNGMELPRFDSGGWFGPVTPSILDRPQPKNKAGVANSSTRMDERVTFGRAAIDSIKQGWHWYEDNLATKAGPVDITPNWEKPPYANTKLSRSALDAQHGYDLGQSGAPGSRPRGFFDAYAKDFLGLTPGVSPKAPEATPAPPVQSPKPTTPANSSGAPQGQPGPVSAPPASTVSSTHLTGGYPGVNNAGITPVIPGVVAAAGMPQINGIPVAGLMNPLASVGGQMAGVPLQSRLGGEGNLQVNTIGVKRAVEAMFPQIANIGGYREDAIEDHPSGKAIDIMIPNYNTPEGKALGDQINQWLQANGAAMGVDSTIWQDFWQPVGGDGHALGRSGDTQGHRDHIHVKTTGGGYPTGAEQYMLPGLMQQYPGGLPGGVTADMLTGDSSGGLFGNIAGLPDFMQPSNIAQFLVGQAGNIGSSLLGIGTQLLTDLTGINFNWLADLTRQVGNGAGQAASGWLNLGGSSGGGGGDVFSQLLQQGIGGLGNVVGDGGSGQYLNQFLYGNGQLPIEVDPSTGLPIQPIAFNDNLLQQGGGLASPGKKGGNAYRAMIRQALQMYGPQLGITNAAAWENALVKQIDTESGGDPFSFNGNDSDGQGGTQQVMGLFNFLPSTFDSYNAVGGSINDPWSQIVAAIAYTKSQYGQDPNTGVPNQIGQGHGFKSGGHPNSGLAWLSRGEFVTNRDATRYYGKQLFDDLNARRLPRFSGGGFFGKVGDFLGGVGSSAWDAGKGIYQAVGNPAMAVGGAARGLAPLVGLGGGGSPSVGDAWRQFGKNTVHWDEWGRNPARAAGMSAFDIASAFVPGGAALKGTRAGSVASSAARRGFLKGATPAHAHTAPDAMDLGRARAYANDIWPYSKSDNPFTPAELDAIYGYTKGSGVNGTLRALASGKGHLVGSDALSEHLRQVAGIDSAFGKANRVPDDFVVNRELDAAGFGNIHPNDDLTRLLGRTFSDPGYTSTSVGAGGRPSPYVMQLLVPRGSHGLWLSGRAGRESLSHFGRAENELLLPRGGSYTPFDVRPEGRGARVFAQWNPPQLGLPIPGKAGGGLITGPGTGRSDSVPLMGSKGEFMMRDYAVKKYGLDFMHLVNAGQFEGGGWWMPQPYPGQTPGPLPQTPQPPAPPEPGQQPGVPQPATPGPLTLGAGAGTTPSTGGAPGPGATAPAPDPGALPGVQDALTNVGGLAGLLSGTGGVGSAQPGADASQSADPRASLGAAPSSQEHNLPALSSGIQGAWNHVGSLVATAASMAASGASMGATAGAGGLAGGAGGQLAGAGIQAGFQIGGQIATGLTNVLSSLLVGTATNGSTASASGTPLLPAQPDTSGVPSMVQGRVHNGDNVYQLTNLDEFKRQQRTTAAQEAMPYIGKYGV